MRGPKDSFAQELEQSITLDPQQMCASLPKCQAAPGTHVMLRRPYAAVAGLLQLPLQLIAIHRLDGDFTGAPGLVFHVSTRSNAICCCRCRFVILSAILSCSFACALLLGTLLLS